MVISLVSMKGGVGKSTIAAMLAKHIAQTRGHPVTVVDMDPQCGVSVILLGPQTMSKHNGFSIFDVLESELANNPSDEILRQASSTSPYHELIRVIPSHKSLGNLAGPETPRELLHLALSSLPSSEAITIIDTGSDIAFCEMSIVASDLVFIPITMAAQSELPTLNTIQAAFKFNRTIGGLIPTITGKAQWVKKRIEKYRRGLENSKLVRAHEIDILPHMPSSQSAARGVWRWANIPDSFIPMLDAITLKVFKEDLTDHENRLSNHLEASNELFVEEGMVSNARK